MPPVAAAAESLCDATPACLWLALLLLLLVAFSKATSARAAWLLLLLLGVPLLMLLLTGTPIMDPVLAERLRGLLLLLLC